MNFFLSLWNSNQLTFGAGYLLLALGIINGIVGVYALRHDCQSQAVSSRFLRLPILGFFLALAFGVVGIFADNLFLWWVALSGLSVLTVAGLLVYGRDDVRVRLRQHAIRTVLAALLTLIGIGIMVWAGHGAGLGFFGSFSANALLQSTMSATFTRVAFLCVLFGSGIMIGVAPISFGLSELYSKIPSPLAGLLAPLTGIVGIFGILHMRGIVDVANADEGIWSGLVLFVFGLATMIIMAIALFAQHNYKQWFARFHEFQIGFILFLCGAGIAGVIPGFMHLSAVAITTSLLFGLTAILHATYKTTKLPGIRSLFHIMPKEAAILLVVLAGGALLPCSSLFMSAFIGLGYTLQLHPWFALLAGISLVLASVATIKIALGFLAKEEEDMVLQKTTWPFATGILALGACSLLILAWFIGTEEGVNYFVNISGLIAQL